MSTLLTTPLSGAAEGVLPPWEWHRALTDWGLEPWLFVGTVWVAGLYLWGVRSLAAKGVRWPLGRTLALVLGLGAFAVVTQGGLAIYDTTLLSVHMVQHMVLSMVVPVLLALAAPVTLALRTLPHRPRSWLLAVLHSPVGRVLSFPPLALVLYVASPWALYFSGWYDASLASPFVHEMMHVHLVAVGTLFFWPLLGVDPIPGRVGYPFRLLLIFLTLPFHAFLGVTIMGMTDLIGGDHYPDLAQRMPWLPDPLADQYLAGGILWSSGEVVGLLFFGVLFTQWVRSSMREAKRVDRALDRAERSAAMAAEQRAGAAEADR